MNWMRVLELYWLIMAKPLDLVIQTYLKHVLVVAWSNGVLGRDCFGFWVWFWLFSCLNSGETLHVSPKRLPLA